MVDSTARTTLDSISAAFASLGRVFICLDGQFRVLHASPLLDQMLGTGSTAALLGRPIQDLLGTTLFGPAGSLQQALMNGQRREGWRALVEGIGGELRLVAIAVAPLSLASQSLGDPRGGYIVVLARADREPASGGAPIGFSGLIARSAPMTRIFGTVQDLADSDATVLLTGESGVGKGTIAHAIHSHSARGDGPFVPVNCGALPGELLDAELFGHTQDAFTGAVRDRIARLEAAAGGTLFLDQVGDLPPLIQTKLLRVLQDHTFARVGDDDRRRPADARIIAATNVNLEGAVQEGRFSEELYARLRVVPIDVPPLRQRREDIPPLARFLLGRACARQGRPLRFSPAALRLVLQYHWPGNVRELDNAIEYAVAVCKGEVLLPEDLPLEVQAWQSGLTDTGAAGADGERRAEAKRLRHALDVHRWSRRDTARALGISRTTLWRLMREYGLQVSPDEELE